MEGRIQDRRKLSSDLTKLPGVDLSGVLLKLIEHAGQTLVAAGIQHPPQIGQYIQSVQEYVKLPETVRAKELNTKLTETFEIVLGAGLSLWHESRASEFYLLAHRELLRLAFESEDQKNPTEMARLLISALTSLTNSAWCAATNSDTGKQLEQREIDFQIGYLVGNLQKYEKEANGRRLPTPIPKRKRLSPLAQN